MQSEAVFRQDYLACHDPEMEVPYRAAKATFHLDWPRRYFAMRLHTAFHALVGLAYPDYGARVAGGDMPERHARLDFTPEIDRAGIESLVEQANREIIRGGPVTVESLPAAQARKQPELIKRADNRIPHSRVHYRVIHIHVVDRLIDGGIHVADLGEVGAIRILKISAVGRGRKRLKFTIDAFDHHGE
ncbi:MAG: hypothetical protein Q4Q03_03465 [Bowdeniella nasicola]|nr:hypothetical protein [Bowdeniella nasicola]